MRRGELGREESWGPRNGLKSTGKSGRASDKRQSYQYKVNRIRSRASGERVGAKNHCESARYRTRVSGGAKVRYRSVFACALVFSPERVAGQTACPEESLARARKGCDGGNGAKSEMSIPETGGDLKLEISDLRFLKCGGGPGTLKCERSNLRAD
jgi:hypothetical protein